MRSYGKLGLSKDPGDELHLSQLQLKLSPIRRTNQMSHLWWNTWRWSGCFWKHKSSTLWRREQNRNAQPQWNFFSHPKCTGVYVVPVQNWSSKNQSSISPLGLSGPLWRRNGGGYIGASWPTLNRKAPNWVSVSTGPCSDSIKAHLVHQNTVKGASGDTHAS